MKPLFRHVNVSNFLFARISNPNMLVPLPPKIYQLTYYVPSSQIKATHKKECQEIPIRKAKKQTPMTKKLMPWSNRTWLTSKKNQNGMLKWTVIREIPNSRGPHRISQCFNWSHHLMWFGICMSIWIKINCTCKSPWIC